MAFHAGTQPAGLLGVLTTFQRLSGLLRPRSLPKDERTMNALLNEIETEPTTLEFLVEAAQAGDREAFGELVTRFEGMVYAIAFRRLNNHAEAQELSQEVFVKAM